MPTSGREAPTNSKRLDHKLDCKACGTIQMDIPDNAGDHTPIHCINCGGYLGEWGELQDDFYKQAADTQAFDLRDGNIIKK
jgi:transcription elongation factor Elf1